MTSSKTRKMSDTESNTMTNTTDETNTNPAIEESVRELEEAIAAQKAFKKENKELFDANRQHTKTVNKLKEQLKAVMVEQGVSNVTVGNTEVEIKQETRTKHNAELLESLFDDPEKYSEYMEHTSESSAKVVARRAKRQRAN